MSRSRHSSRRLRIRAVLLAHFALKCVAEHHSGKRLASSNIEDAKPVGLKQLVVDNGQRM